MDRDVSELEARLGHTFRDRNLLRTALTHTSYLNETADLAEHNQRLEYLGDAIVDFLVAEVLYYRFPYAREGEMTRWRALLVSTEGLAELAQRLDLGEHLLLGRGEEATGGRQKPANLAAGLEALVAALYLDSDWETVKRVMLPHFRPYIEQATAMTGPWDARSRLQEEVQARLGITPRYVEVGGRGPDHRPVFTVEVMVGDEVWGRGEGPSKRAAAQAAAEQALRRLD
ncbi:MAG: ribonuclease III [Anaerolineae bacterium]